MSTTTIYVTAKHKQKENVGHYGIALWQEKATQPTEKFAKKASTSRGETQLTALIQGISLLKKPNSDLDVVVVTDFTLVKNFLDGTIYDWERNDWQKENEKELPNAPLWEQLSDLVTDHNISFVLSEGGDGKMDDLTKKLLSNTRKTTKSTTKKPKKDTSSKKAEKQVAKEVDQAPKAVKATKVAKVEKAPKAEKTPKVEKVLKKAKAAKVDKTQKVAKETKPAKEVKATKAAKATPVEKPVKAPKTTSPSLNIDPTLLKESQVLFSEIGLDLDLVVTMFLKDSVRKKGLTLDLKL